MRKKFFLIAVIAFGVGVTAFFLLISLVVRTEPPRVAVEPSFLDFGDIIQSAGPVTRAVKVKNVGGAPLVVNRLSTSCGCTTARMNTSPLESGEERVMEITFDPMVHPDEFGPITRVVYVQTSDGERPEVEIDVVGKVVPE